MVNYSNLWQKLKRFLEFESGYGTFSTKMESIKYFLRQGPLIPHLIDRIKFRWFPKFRIVSNFPSHLDIETASACQMKCPMCWTTYMDNSKKGIMSFDLYKRIIDEAVKNKVYSVKLSWRGEPMLNKNLIQMIRYAKESGIHEVAMLSNGERMTPKLGEEIVHSGLDWISFSFDGMKDTYDVIRAPAKFEETVERIRLIRQYRDRIGSKKPLIRVQSLLSVIRDRADEFLDIWEGIADKVNFISDQSRDFEVSELAHDPNYSCPTMYQRMSINHEGLVHQCISDYNGTMILGNVKEQSLYQIWHGEQYRKLRQWFTEHTALKNCQACRVCTDNVFTVQESMKVKGKVFQIKVYKNIEPVKDRLAIPKF
jgi:radical SAM protein with 4Fe4S-binding SPASM domain